MATIQEQLANFQRFVEDQLAKGSDSPSIDELYDRWRVEHPSQAELDENVAAVKASLADLHQGERGISHDEHMSELRDRYGSFDE